MVGLASESEARAASEITFLVGESVKVVDGPFSGFKGTIQGVSQESYELTVGEDGKLSLSDKPKYLSEYNTPTAIQSASGTIRQASGIVYDLQGRKVGTSENALPHGIYIIDGKKVIR